jgi:hypothetical protein
MHFRFVERALLLMTCALGCAPDPQLEAERPRPAAATGTPARSASARPPLGRAAPVGGDWLRCYGNFVPRVDPRHDLARLTASCGARNRMRRRLGPIEGSVVEGGKPAEHRFRVVQGGCYRVFAVGEPFVRDLDVEVLSADGRRVAYDTGEDRWPIVEPDRPFCAFEAGEYRAVVRAQRGSGRYALAIHQLVDE